jgi:hypothetical protein
MRLRDLVDLRERQGHADGDLIQVLVHRPALVSQVSVGFSTSGSSRS